MDLENRMQLIREVGEEIITEQELRELLETNKHPVAYDGFEPSGLAHLPFGVFRPLLLKDLLKAGVRFKLFLADWHAMINNKMGGDLDKIKKVGKYFIEVWKAAGVDLDKVDIVWASDIMNIDYWGKAFKIGENVTVKRARRALSIMGRSESELSDAAQLFYPIMQVADIFQLDVDICQLGLDQRRANIMAREIAHKFGWKVPVAVHHHMLLGLQGSKQKDVKVSFDEAKECFKEIERWVYNLGESLNNSLLKKRFAANIPYDLRDVQEMTQEIKTVLKRRLEKLENMFENYPKSLNSFVTGELPSLTKQIRDLITLPVSATSENKNILLEEWLDWRKKWGEIHAKTEELLKNASMELNDENREVDFESKMSKSNPSSAIFVHDTREVIFDKLRKAYCPPKVAESNPVLDYSKHIIFRHLKNKKKNFEIDRPAKFGGPLSFGSYAELEKAYVNGKLHPMDLKNAVSRYIDGIVMPIRDHFESDRKAKALLEQVKKFEVTR
jgi:tyrosyl-tRNA synthetase